MRKNHRYGLIIITLILAFCLAILPLPDSVNMYRPYWLMLVIIFWTLALPDGFGVVLSWCVGLLFDVSQGALLGQNAFAMMLVSYLTYKLHYQLRAFPIWQQSIAVFLFISLAQLFVIWTNILIGQTVMTYWQYGIGILISAAIWPWIYSLLHSYQQRYRIH